MRSCSRPFTSPPSLASADIMRPRGPLRGKLLSGGAEDALGEVAVELGGVRQVALRISDYRLALRLLEGYPNTEGAARQRAAARVHTGASDVVESALAELHDIALGDGPEAELAGLNRLMSCVVKPQLPWDDEV